MPINNIIFLIFMVIDKENIEKGVWYMERYIKGVMGSQEPVGKRGNHTPPTKKVFWKKNIHFSPIIMIRICLIC